MADKLSFRPLSELIPWLFPLDEGRVIVNKDSSLMATYEITGIDTDSVQIADINWLSENVQRAMMGLSDLPFTVWFTVRRGKTDEWPGLRMPEAVSQLIDDERHESFLNGENFVNRTFITLMSTPQVGLEKFKERVNNFVREGEPMVKALFYSSMSMISKKYAFAYSGKELDQALDQFNNTLTTFVDRISRVSPRRLSGNEYFAFLNGMASPLNGFKSREMKMPNGYGFLDQMVGQSTIDVFGKMLRIEGQESGFVSAQSVKGWPKYTFPDMGMGGLTESILLIPGEITISQIFRVSPREKTVSYLKGIRQYNEMLSYPLLQYIFSAFNGGNMNPDRGNKTRMDAALQANAALTQAQAGVAMYGWYNYTVTAAGPTAEATEEMDATISKAFTACQMSSVREKLHLLSAFAGTMPGNVSHVARWAFLRSENVADFAPMRSEYSGEKINKYLTEQTQKVCPAVTVLNTAKNTPYNFNFHVADLGHTFIVGPSRTGKTSFVNFLISQWRKYGARVIIFDKDHSCRITTILHDGKYIDIKPGSKDFSVNPFALVTDLEHHEFLSRWVEGLITSRGHRITTQDEMAIASAIHGVYVDEDPKNHRLLTCCALLPQELQEYLYPWVGDGPLARYFDNEEDHLDFADFTAMEMGALMSDERVSSAYLDYAFYRLWMILKNQETPVPTLIYVEECWFFMKNPKFEAKILDWLKTFAKKLAHLVLATQSVDELANSSIFSAIRDNIPTRIFLPNVNATSESLSKLYRGQFELTDEQIQLIRNATPKRNYFITQPGAAKMVDCSFTPAIMACIRSDTAAQLCFNKHYNNGHPANENWKVNYIEEMMAA